MPITLSTGLQYLHFAGVELALDYQCANNSPTSLLVLVNGYQRTRLDFRAFRKKLEKIAPHVATVAFDNRYCGDTKVTTNHELSLEIMAQDTYNIANIFLDKLNLKSFSLLGISMGGMITQSLASLLPYGILENLFLVSTTSGGVGRTWPRPIENPNQQIRISLSPCTRREERRVQKREAAHKRRSNDVQGLNEIRIKYENKNIDLESTKKNMARFFADKFLKNSPLLFEMMCKNMLKTATTNEYSTAAAEQYRVSVHFDGASSLNKISAQKTIIFTGDEDKIIPPANALYLNQHIQDSQLITYTQVGHLILIEEPEKFVQDIASFF